MLNPLPLLTEQPPLRVSELNQLARGLLETHFSHVQVEGELSNVTCAPSGHWYFTLKDERAQVRCVLFKSRHVRTKLWPEEGMHVLVRAKVSLYEGRGDFQLLVETLEEMGDGALRRAFEQLKKKLEAAGLFAVAHKKTFPALIRTLGVITSDQGAALHDILVTLKRRFPALSVIIYPSLVQGKEAAASLCAAIATANRRAECDALILARGGGSLEDLWAFNDEMLAHTIFNSALPIVTGIGHETDVTLADFVADHRAATPTAAAEFVSPLAAEYNAQLQQLRTHLINLQTLQAQRIKEQLHFLSTRLIQQHPKQQLLQKAQTLDHLTTQLITQQRHQLLQARSRLQSCLLPSPLALIERAHFQWKTLHTALHTTLQTIMKEKNRTLAYSAGQLHALSPLNTLARGYSVTYHDQHIIATVTALKKGDTLTTTFATGKCVSVVEKII